MSLDSKVMYQIREENSKIGQHQVVEWLLFTAVIQTQSEISRKMINIRGVKELNVRKFKVVVQ